MGKVRFGYSTTTLWREINNQWEQIYDEVNWMNHYIATGETDYVEDCVRNIIHRCNTILHYTADLKGEEM